MAKKYVSEKMLIQDSFKLGMKVYESGFRPDFLIGLWRGGSSVGIYVQECLQYLGVETDHISLRTSYQGQPDYQDMIDSDQEIKVHGMQYLLENLNNDNRLLIVDDVFSSGSNTQAVINQLQARLKRNMPQDTKIAATWYKPKRNRGEHVPDFYINTTDEWLVLPYELTGLTMEEIETHKPGVKEILDSV
tara:strand:- start:3259 stop:3828 length:570 start_codon:yes stop_codon:yes gene_type:complete